MVDLNNDGKLDLYVSNGGGTQNKLWINGYSDTKPYVEQKNAINFSKLLGFKEVLSQNNEGTVSYQVSSDDGTTWKYWNGTAWTATTQLDGAETTSATDINTNIKTLATSGKFKWRAYLESDGNQIVELDQVELDYNYATVELLSDTSEKEGTALVSGTTTPQIFVKGVLTDDATITLSVSGTAIEGKDYDIDSKVSITVVAGDYSAGKAIDIPGFAVIDDSTIEADETLTFKISNVVGGGITVADANGDSSVDKELTHTILNDDSAELSIKANTTTINENPIDKGVFTVSLDKVTTKDTVINYSITGTTKNGSDYTNLAGTVTILAGKTTATIDVDTVDDVLVEGDEKLIITIDSTNNSNVIIDTNNASVMV